MREENFGEEGRQYNGNRPQYRVAMKLLERIPTGSRVLDVGSGLGEFTDLLIGRGYDVCGVEGVKMFVEEQVQRGLNVRQVDLENDKLPFEDNSFDIVVSLDVIEHLWNTTHYLEEINRCLREGGYFIVSTVNYNFWKYRLLHLRGRMEDFVFGSRHKKFYTWNSLPKELDTLFDIEDVAYSHSGMVTRRAVRPNLLVQQFAFLCRPKKGGAAPQYLDR